MHTEQRWHNTHAALPCPLPVGFSSVSHPEARLLPKRCCGEPVVCCWCCCCCCCRAVWSALLSCWGPRLQPPPSQEQLAAARAAGSAANAASALHALDLGSRSLLHDALAACAQVGRMQLMARDVMMPEKQRRSEFCCWHHGVFVAVLLQGLAPCCIMHLEDNSRPTAALQKITARHDMHLCSC
jgi:hypothetical protein